jgi:hypothetical protein
MLACLDRYARFHAHEVFLRQVQLQGPFKHAFFPWVGRQPVECYFSFVGDRQRHGSEWIKRYLNVVAVWARQSRFELTLEKVHDNRPISEQMVLPKTVSMLGITASEIGSFLVLFDYYSVEVLVQSV